MRAIDLHPLPGRLPASNVLLCHIFVFSLIVLQYPSHASIVAVGGERKEPGHASPSDVAQLPCSSNGPRLSKKLEAFSVLEQSPVMKGQEVRLRVGIRDRSNRSMG